VPLRDRTDRAVIHKESEWVDFAKAVGKPVKQPAKDKQKSKPVYEDEHQLELF
jgi:hypothetical protein